MAYYRGEQALYSADRNLMSKVGLKSGFALFWFFRIRFAEGK